MFEPLKGILKRRFDGSDARRINLSKEIFDRWGDCLAEEFGEGFREEAKPLMFKRGCLIVKARSSVFACELQLKKDKLKALLNKGLLSSPVKEISLKT